MGKQSIFVGQRFKNKSGEWFEVIEYITGKKIRIRFDESKYECIVEGQEIRRGCVVDVYSKYPKQGDVYSTTQCGDLEVLEYRNAKDVLVRFIDTGYTTSVETCQLKRGNIKDWLSPSVAKVGYIGVGEYSPYEKGTHKPSWAYLKWQNMLERCYDPWCEQTAITYSGVTVCDEWHNFQNFAKWAVVQYGYGIRTWAMEKDLLIKGNRFYAADRCCFLPQELNNQMLRSEKARGEYPIGVSLNKPNGKFIAHLSDCKEGSSSSHIGIFETPEEAFYAYKVAKEAKLKRLANKWKDQIDPRAYEALMKYEVLITD